MGTIKNTGHILDWSNFGHDDYENTNCIRSYYELEKYNNNLN